MHPTQLLTAHLVGQSEGQEKKSIQSQFGDAKVQFSKRGLLNTGMSQNLPCVWDHKDAVRQRPETRKNVQYAANKQSVNLQRLSPKRIPSLYTY